MEGRIDLIYDKKDSSLGIGLYFDSEKNCILVERVNPVGTGLTEAIALGRSGQAHGDLIKKYLCGIEVTREHPTHSGVDKRSVQEIETWFNDFGQGAVRPLKLSFRAEPCTFPPGLPSQSTLALQEQHDAGAPIHGYGPPPPPPQQPPPPQVVVDLAAGEQYRYTGSKSIKIKENNYSHSGKLKALKSMGARAADVAKVSTGEGTRLADHLYKHDVFTFMDFKVGPGDKFRTKIRAISTQTGNEQEGWVKLCELEESFEPAATSRGGGKYKKKSSKRRKSKKRKSKRRKSKKRKSKRRR